MTRQKKFNLFIIFFFIVFTLTILGGLGYSYLHFTQMKENIDETKLKTKAYNEKSEMLKSIEKKYLDVESDLDVLDVALPPQKESSKLIKDLEKLANQNGLDLKSVKATGNAKPTGDLSLSQTIKGKYSQELPLELTLEGPYANFVSYIKKLENYRRLNNVSGFSVSSSLSDNKEVVNVKLKITVYLNK